MLTFISGTYTSRVEDEDPYTVWRSWLKQQHPEICLLLMLKMILQENVEETEIFSQWLYVYVEFSTIKKKGIVPFLTQVEGYVNTHNPIELKTQLYN